MQNIEKVENGRRSNTELRCEHATPVDALMHAIFSGRTLRLCVRQLPKNQSCNPMLVEHVLEMTYQVSSCEVLFKSTVLLALIQIVESQTCRTPCGNRFGACHCAERSWMFGVSLERQRKSKQIADEDVNTR